MPSFIYEPKYGGGGGCGGVSANEYSCAHGAQINFADLTPYLTYGRRLVVDVYLYKVQLGLSKDGFRLTTNKLTEKFSADSGSYPRIGMLRIKRSAKLVVHKP